MRAPGPESPPPTLLTSVLGGLVAEDPVGGNRVARLDHVHLGVSASTTEDVLTLLTWGRSQAHHLTSPVTSPQLQGALHSPDTTGTGHLVLQGSLQSSLWAWRAFSSFWIFCLTLSRTP